MDIVVAVALGAIGSIIAAELYAYGPAIAHALIRRAVARLTKHEQTRFLEEWLADNREFIGNGQKVLHAIGCCVGARAVAKVLAKPQITRQSSDLKEPATSHKRNTTGDESEISEGVTLDMQALNELMKAKVLDGLAKRTDLEVLINGLRTGANKDILRIIDELIIQSQEDLS